MIASSVSNGGGAALAAAEQDTEGLIDGVAVGEPDARAGAQCAASIVKQRQQTLAAAAARPLLRLLHARQPVPAVRGAVAARRGLAGRPGVLPNAGARSEPLRRAEGEGLLTAATTAEQADGVAGHAARMRLAAGVEPAPGVALRASATSPVVHDVRERLRALQRHGQPLRLLVRADRRGRQAGAARRRGAGADLRHRQRRSADERRSTSSTTTTPAGRCSTADLGLAVDRRARTTTSTARICLRNLMDRHRRQRACACRTASRRRCARAQPARQAGDHRARPRRHAGAGQLQRRGRTTARTRSSKARRASSSYIEVHQRAALRRVHRQRGAAGLRLALRAAALLLHPGDGPRCGRT